MQEILIILASIFCLSFLAGCRRGHLPSIESDIEWPFKVDGYAALLLAFYAFVMSAWAGLIGIVILFGAFALGDRYFESLAKRRALAAIRWSHGYRGSCIVDWWLRSVSLGEKNGDDDDKFAGATVSLKKIGVEHDLFRRASFAVIETRAGVPPCRRVFFVYFDCFLRVILVKEQMR